MSEKPTKGRKIRDADDARAVLAQIPETGLTLAAYCAAHDINRWSLYYWRSQLTRQRLKKPGKKNKGSPPTLPTFAEVQIPALAARYAIRAPSGWAVEIDDAFDTQRLAALLEVVARC